MLEISGGSFMMGSDGGERVGDDEKPAHRVAVSRFYLGKYEVTNAEYKRFVVSTNHPPPPTWKGTNFPAGQDNVPVTNVSWNDAVAYCAWLASREPFKYRLPSEEEWEYAARKDQRIYPWGDEFVVDYTNSLERTQGNQFSKSLPLEVTKYSDTPSPFGTVNQAGNVAEWTASDVKAYPGSTKPIKGAYKVYRGGSYAVDKFDLRTTTRYWLTPDKKEPWLGFRVAMDAPGAAGAR